MRIHNLRRSYRYGGWTLAAQRNRPLGTYRPGNDDRGGISGV
ncbi:hypothetical protein [Baaleninema sp.]